MLESGIVGVHHHLGQYGGHALLKAPVQQFLLQSILQVIADIALAHGHAHGKGHHVGGGLLLAVGGKGVLDHAHLGAVAMGDDHLVPGLDQIGNGAGGLLHGLHLLRQVLSQGIAAQGDDDSFTHIVSSFLTVIAGIQIDAVFPLLLFL